MVRGSTPTHRFKLPFCSDNVKECRITYVQSGGLVLEKSTEDCIFNDVNIQTTLTREETLRFSAGESIKVQLEVLTHGGQSLPSQIFTIPCARIQNSEVLE